MNHRKLFLYIVGALFFTMCGSLWQEFVASGGSNQRHNIISSSRNSATRNSYYAVPRAAVESFEFDPNEADSTQLLRLGLTPAQVRSIYRHRAKGYVYSTPEDFARTPFMTKGQWNHLCPLIRIADRYKPVNLNLESLNPVLRASDGAERSERNPANSLSSVTSHTADSLATVSRSVRSENQDSTLHSPLFTLHSRKDSIFHSSLFIINLNDASFKELVRHPFLSYEQVKAVKNFQRKYGRIRNMTELLILPEFTVEDTLRLSPYLQF